LSAVFSASLSGWQLPLRKFEYLTQLSRVIVACRCCCGLIPDDDATIKDLIPVLNGGWIKNVNKRLSDGNAGFKLDVFLWQWHNVSGKSETNILLIRFFEVA
jgi:hypothetical protein